MQLLIAPLLSWLGSVAARFIGDTALKWIALKVLSVTLLTVTLPIVLKNILTWLVQQVELIVRSYSGGSVDSFSVQLTGLAGYLGDQMMLGTCVSIILTAIAIRLFLNFVPFVG